MKNCVKMTILGLFLALPGSMAGSLIFNWLGKRNELKSAILDQKLLDLPGQTGDEMALS